MHDPDRNLDQLAALQAQAEAVDAEMAANYAAPAAEEAAPAVMVDASAEAEAIIKTAVMLAGDAYPTLRQVYTDDKIVQIAQAAAPVMEKYGWNMGGLFEQWGAEIQLAIVLIPVGMATAAAIRTDKAARAAKQEAANDGESAAA
ncbi:hypothetical protein ACTSKR_09550 [Chitinibacteraceae bacterium HSL-7]